MSDAKTASRRLFEDVWNHKNLAAIDELMAASYVHHDPQTPKFPEGIEGYKQLVNYYLKAFPDCQFTIDLARDSRRRCRRDPLDSKRHTPGRFANTTCDGKNVFRDRNQYRSGQGRKIR